MSSQKNVLETILSSSRSVFNVQSLMMLTESEDSQKLTKSLHYYVKEGKIRNPRRGIYTKVTYDERKWLAIFSVLPTFRWSMYFSEQVSCFNMTTPLRA